jgi:hypothetical protein
MKNALTHGAFLGSQEIKQKYLDRIAAHRAADRILQSYGYWKDGKGCAVGCAVHSSQTPHKKYEKEICPEALARLEDAIFERLPVDLARLWPSQFLETMAPGSDQRLTTSRFLVWLLEDKLAKWATPESRAVAKLYRRRIAGDEPSREEWKAATNAAKTAATNAYIATNAITANNANAAAYIAAAAAADTTTYAATYAANAVTYATYATHAVNAACAATPTDIVSMSEVLLDIMRTAPMMNGII